MDGYIQPFSDRVIPLNHLLSDQAVNNIQRGEQGVLELQKIASTGGRGFTGGASAQLLSTNASSDKFEALIEKFSYTSGQGQRK